MKFFLLVLTQADQSDSPITIDQELVLLKVAHHGPVTSTIVIPTDSPGDRS
jgi:hypothetical protein